MTIFIRASGASRPARGLRPRRAVAIVASAALITGVAVAGATATTASAQPSHEGVAASRGMMSSCHLGNGIQHVVQLIFDNVHFYRDNPNVPSDLELMPNLLDFFSGNGAFLTNNHTPLIAHTADDILSTYTGLYGDRHGMPVSNSYQAYNSDGPNGSYDTTNPAGSFAYWTDPVYDTAKTPSPAADTNPNMVYSPVPPTTAAKPVSPTTTTPAPWVPYTRAGCDWGGVATANVELENTSVDIPKVFGAGSPEDAQLAADTDSFKDAETADYVGVAVHCAQGSAFCSDATAVKYGQASPSHTATPDLLPDEPGGYDAHTALFGHKYVAPQLGAGTPGVTDHGYQVTNAAGNLVDLNGNQLNGAFLSNYPGFPGFSSINASQTLAYMSDMLESGVPVVNGYISDIHGNEHIPGLAACNSAPAALGSGTQCYIAQAAYYNQAFGEFFKRLATDGITPKNTLFLLNVDEGDHEAGANVGRSVQPVPDPTSPGYTAGTTTCDGATVHGTTVTPDVYCTYPAGTFGELAGNLTGLLATEKNDTTPFTVEADTAPEFYVTGDPGPNEPAVRQLEKDVATLTASNPYAGGPQAIANYIADPVEEGILHMVNADPARTPTFALFAKPDYYLSTGSATCPAAGCVTQNAGFAWDHGDYAAEINTDFAAFAGPGVARVGIDGSGPADGPTSAGANSGQLTPVDVQGSNPGPWTDTTDIRATELHLLGLTDDYQGDGQVISSILSTEPPQLRSGPVKELAACYKQLNSSVGEFGAYTLEASTSAVESTTSADAKFKLVNAALLALEKSRDALAGQIKAELAAADAGQGAIRNPLGQLAGCQGLIVGARLLAAASSR